MINKEKQVRISIITDRYDESEKLLAPLPGDGKGEPRTKHDTIEYATTAHYSRIDGKVNIKYDDSKLFDGEETWVTLKYDLAEPGVVTMVRGGTVTTTMVFEAGKRNISLYNNQVMPFELCIFTHKVSNNVERRGTLDIDYVTEIHGVRAERAIMKIRIYGLERKQSK